MEGEEGNQKEGWEEESKSGMSTEKQRCLEEEKNKEHKTNFRFRQMGRETGTQKL